MSNGLNKLTDAAAQVDLLRKELERNQEEIAVKNVRVEAVSDVAEEPRTNHMWNWNMVKSAGVLYVVTLTAQNISEKLQEYYNIATYYKPCRNISGIL